MPTTIDTIAIAKISQYLWDNDISNQSQLFGGSIDVGRAKKLYMERKALEYGNAQALANTTAATTYVFSMCGGMVNVATQIYGTGGSGGTVVPGSGGSYGVYEFSGNATLNNISISFPLAIGKRLIDATRGAQDVGAILTSGTPTGSQVMWESTTGTLYVASTVPYYDQEFVRVIVQ